MPEHLAPEPDGVGVVEVVPNDYLSVCHGSSAWLLFDLEKNGIAANSVVFRHDALVLDAHELIEVDMAILNEDALRLPWLASEPPIEAGHEALCDEPVGIGDGSDACGFELVDQAVLQSAE